jgi:hypothetical protein
MSFPSPSQSTVTYLFSWTSSLISLCFAGRSITWMVQHPWQTSVHSSTSKTTQHFISAVSSPMASFNITRFLQQFCLIQRRTWTHMPFSHLNVCHFVEVGKPRCIGTVRAWTQMLINRRWERDYLSCRHIQNTLALLRIL